MTYKFGKTSLDRLGTCHIDLQRLALAAIETSPVDFAIACGHRCKEEQDAAYAHGYSKVKWPNGKHNSTPSRAFDFVPFVNGRADWSAVDNFKTVAHHILMTADQMGVEVRWGGDWNMNGVEDEKWYDRPHIELKG